MAPKVGAVSKSVLHLCSSHDDLQEMMPSPISIRKMSETKDKERGNALLQVLIQSIFHLFSLCLVMDHCGRAPDKANLKLTLDQANMPDIA